MGQMRWRVLGKDTRKFSSITILELNWQNFKKNIKGREGRVDPLSLLYYNIFNILIYLRFDRIVCDVFDFEQHRTKTYRCGQIFEIIVICDFSVF